MVPDANREISVRIGGASRKVRFADVTVSLLPPDSPFDEGGYDSSLVHEWHAQVGFFTEWQSPPWNVLLGQVGFLDEFTVTFNRVSAALAVTAVDDFDTRFPNASPTPGPVLTPRFKP